MGKMKESSLLKWAHNNRNNKLSGKGKEDKKKNWIHPPENLTSGHIAYLVKFLGCTEVDQPKGIEVVKEGIRKLKFSQQIKKAEGSKTPKVELTVSVDGVAIQDPKSKRIQHQYPLQRISYCADDKAEKRFFSFIAKEEEENKHTCYVFVSDKLAEEITLTIGQAFDLAYKRYLSGQSEGEDKISRLERENVILKQRLKEMSSVLSSTQLNNFLDKHNITEVCEVRREQVTDNQDSTNANNVKAMSLDSSQTSSGEQDSSDDQLINLDTPVSKFDTMTLDDLNDDDFDPRAGDQTGDSDSSDEFNPRGFPTPVIRPPGSSSGPASPTPVILSPPTLPAIPPRDPAKVGSQPPVQVGSQPPAAPAPRLSTTNPFGQQLQPDPFGMDMFASPGKQQVGFGNPGSSPFPKSDFSLSELDPFKS